MSSTLHLSASSAPGNPRLTRSSSRVTSSDIDRDLPRPTLADVSIAPRRPLRNGTSSRGTSSRGTSVASSASRGGRRPSSTPSVMSVDTPAGRSRRTAPIAQPTMNTRSRTRDSELSASASPQRATRQLPSVRGRGQARAPPLGQRLISMDRSASGSASSSASSSFVPEAASPPRFSTQEKGKARAIVSAPIEIEDSSQSDEVEVLEPPRKRKRQESAGGESQSRKQANGDSEDKVRVGGKGDTGGTNAMMIPEEESIASYTCPICFGAPQKPVITTCGHVLCGQCLLDALLAAIKRDPLRAAGVNRGGRGGRGGRARGRGGPHRGGHARRGRAGGDQLEAQPELASLPALSGPLAWSADGLLTAWHERRIREYTHNLRQSGVDPDAFGQFLDLDDGAPKEGDYQVIELLKGLWEVKPVPGITGNAFHVVEGECPVCRVTMPGGMGPLDSGVGGVRPLKIRVGAPRARA